MNKTSTRVARIVRHNRVRARLEGNGSRPRLAVFRSLKHIYVQIIDDTKGHTLLAASTLDPDIRGRAGEENKTSRARIVGEAIARKAVDKGIIEVVFDRGGYRYHGRVKSLAEAARKAGLKF